MLFQDNCCDQLFISYIFGGDVDNDNKIEDDNAN